MLKLGFVVVIVDFCVHFKLQGYFLLFESMLDSVLYARDLYLADGGSGRWSNNLFKHNLFFFLSAGIQCTKYSIVLSYSSNCTINPQGLKVHSSQCMFLHCSEQYSDCTSHTVYSKTIRWTPAPRWVKNSRKIPKRAKTRTVDACLKIFCVMQFNWSDYEFINNCSQRL